MTKVFPTSRSFGSLVDVLFSAALEEYGRDAETLDFSNILCVCSSPVLVRESQRIFHHVAASKFPGRECYIPPRIVIPVQLSRDAYARRQAAFRYSQWPPNISHTSRFVIRHIPPVRNRSALFLAVCALGVSAFLTQITLMRELLGVFAGNELVLGVVLGNWLLLTGVGAYLGKKSARLRDGVAVLIAAQVLIAILPVVQVFLLRTLRNVVFLRGAEVGVTETVAACSVLLAPYCLIAGYLLTLS